MGEHMTVSFVIVIMPQRSGRVQSTETIELDMTNAPHRIEDNSRWQNEVKHREEKHSESPKK